MAADYIDVMDYNGVDPNAANGSNSKATKRSSLLTSRILHQVNLGLPTLDFMAQASKMLLEFTDCDGIELRVVERGRVLRCEVLEGGDQAVYKEMVRGKRSDTDRVMPCLEADSDLEILCREILQRRFDPSLPFYTPAGSFCIGDTNKPLDLSSESCRWAGGRTLRLRGDFRSIAIIPFTISDDDSGLVLLKSSRQDYLKQDELGNYEDAARVIGIALSQLRAQIALRERVKELTCLFGIAKVAATPEISLDEILRQSVQLLPPGWLHQDVACARIVYEGYCHSTHGFRDDLQTQRAEIVVNGQKRGVIEVAYLKQMPELDEGPFLKEERNLIDAIAGELALIIESRQMEEDKNKLQEQLRHADRLATIGQLAAGVAHELNEPLATILGLAQLDEKIPGIPEQVRKDNERIIAASLHAREVINKLRLFARQAPPHKDRVDLNDIVRDGLYLLESRCAKAGIELVKELDPSVPKIMADPSQLYQVLVNLVVNAVQATPDGGRITIRTVVQNMDVTLCVEDTGIGMDEKVLQNIFTPFFSTKDVDEGTGLGLSVVHGIVESHGGRINVDSKVGQGTRFEVRLPISSPGNAEGE